MVARKRHFCYFCKEWIERPSAHYLKMHSDEMAVARIVAMDQKTRAVERRQAFAHLTRKGDFAHNMRVIDSKEGDLIMARDDKQPSINEFREYGPCPDCYGFFKYHLLFKHVKKCPVGTTVKDVTYRSRALLQGSKDIAEDPIFMEMMSHLRNDKVYQIIVNDDLIMQYACRQYENKGTQEFMRQKIRQLGRLLLELRAITGGTRSLQEYLLDVPNFDTIIDGVIRLCRQHVQNGVSQLERRSIALHLGHQLKKCGYLLAGVGVRNRDCEIEDNAERFVQLMEQEWTGRISAKALSILVHKKRSAIELLPLTEDLKVFNVHVKERVRQERELLEEHPTAERWQILAKFVLARLVLFNKWRSGETARILTSNYEARKTWKDCNVTQEISLTVTAQERGIVQGQQLLQMRGKKGSVVPLILPADVVAPMETLYSVRKTLCLQVQNQYFFSNVFGAGDTCLRGSDCVNFSLPTDGSIKKPDLITSRNLQQYTATVIQMLEMTQQEMGWVLKRLGHSEDVHKTFHRVHHDAVEMTKVAALLVAVKNGQAGDNAGKRLQDIKIQDVEVVEEDEEENDEDDKRCDTLPPPPTDHPSPPPSSDDDRFTPPDQTPTRRKPTRRGTSNKPPRKKRPWRTPERSAVLNSFRSPIEHFTIPGKAEIEDLLRREEALTNRTWLDVKYYCKNTIDHHKKQLKRFKKK